MILRKPFRCSRKKRLERAKFMPTCCVSAICHTISTGSFIVAAADTAITYGNITADVLAAKFFMTRNWVVMSAGDIGSVEVIGDAFSAALRDGQDTADAARRYLRKAYKQQFAEWCTDHVLGPYNMEMHEFLQVGRTKFGDEKFAELTRQIEQESWNFTGELLLAGWGENKLKPSIFVANRDGVYPHNTSGFAAIGSGAQLAVSTLLLHNYTKSSTLDQAIYTVAAAKFAAEADSNVGHNTFMWVGYAGEMIQGKGAPGFMIDWRAIEEMKELWRQYGKPRIPMLGSELAEKLVPKETMERIVRAVKKTGRGRKARK